MKYEPPREPMDDRQFWQVVAALVVGLVIGGGVIVAGEWVLSIFIAGRDAGASQ